MTKSLGDRSAFDFSRSYDFAIFIELLFSCSWILDFLRRALRFWNQILTWRGWQEKEDIKQRVHELLWQESSWDSRDQIYASNNFQKNSLSSVSLLETQDEEEEYKEAYDVVKKLLRKTQNHLHQIVSLELEVLYTFPTRFYAWWRSPWCFYSFRDIIVNDTLSNHSVSSLTILWMLRFSLILSVIETHSLLSAKSNEVICGVVKIVADKETQSQRRSLLMIFSCFYDREYGGLTLSSEMLSNLDNRRTSSLLRYWLWPNCSSRNLISSVENGILGPLETFLLRTLVVCDFSEVWSMASIEKSVGFLSDFIFLSVDEVGRLEDETE